jgi:proline racemase
VTSVSNALPVEVLGPAVGAGKIMVAPNRLDLSVPQGKVKLHLKGNAGGAVTIRIYDVAGRFMGDETVTLNSGGIGVIEYGCEGFDGIPPAPGACWALAEGGGVKDKKMFYVTRKAR